MNSPVNTRCVVTGVTYLAAVVWFFSTQAGGQTRLTDADVPLPRPVLTARLATTNAVGTSLLPRNLNAAQSSHNGSVKTATSKTAPFLDFALKAGKRNQQSELEQAVRSQAARHRIDPLLLFALINQESGGRARARSYKGAMGVMQLMPGTARRFGVRDPFQVSEGVRGGVEYLAWLLDYFKGDVVRALAGYNAGEGAVMRYHGVPPYRETQDYVRRIARRYQDLLEHHHLQRNTTK